METAIKENTDWYYANQGELLSKYNGKFVAISDCGVVGAYDTFGGGVHADVAHDENFLKFVIKIVIYFIFSHCLSINIGWS